MNTLNSILSILTLNLGRWWGVPVSLHWTWTLMAILLLALVPKFFLVYVGLFVIITLHEGGHCWAARRCQCDVKDITLYPIGGAATIQIPIDPWQEIFVALMGPAVNVVLILPLLGLEFLGEIPRMLFLCNLILLVFNLLPVFPMDGGRVLRSFLAMWLKDRYRATLYAARFGQLACLAFGVLGVMSLNLNLCIIAVFLALAAQKEVEQAHFRRWVQLRDEHHVENLIEDGQRHAPPEVEESADILRSLSERVTRANRRSD